VRSLLHRPPNVLLDGVSVEENLHRPEFSDLNLVQHARRDCPHGGVDVAFPADEIANKGVVFRAELIILPRVEVVLEADQSLGAC